MPKIIGRIPIDKVAAIQEAFPEVVCGSFAPEGMRRLQVPDTTPCARVGEIKSAVYAAGGQAAGLAVGRLVSQTLAAVGITPENISSLTGQPCGCTERAALLDRVGWAVQDAVGVGRES